MGILLMTGILIESPRMNVLDETMNSEISKRQSEQNSGPVSTVAG